MIEKKLQKVVIVGGGSAGWMAAAYLRKELPGDIEIVQIESPKVGTIGVGEGTIPVIRSFMSALDLGDSDWISSCNATYKLGIRFNDWLEKGKWWWHPFFFLHPQYPEKAIVDSWLALRQSGCEIFQDIESLGHGCMSWQLAKENRCPAFLDSFGSFEGWNSDHAFHFDAALFGRYLKERVAIPGGVKSVVDHVTDVEISNGLITAIQTEATGRIEGDFFLDCSGFRRVLISKISDAAFVSYENELPCDRAVTMAVPYQDQATEMRPYTVSTALSAGWVWQISLYNRIGAGYVYSGNHLDDDAAEEEFRNFLGKERVADLNANRIRFQAGRLSAPFVGNCVATGLSEGFVEPLEATSLGVTQKHLRLVTEILKQGSIPPTAAVAEDYNSKVCTIHDEIKDFLVSHYCLTHRRDSAFWRDVSELQSPLHAIIDQGSAALNGRFTDAGVFSSQSWICLAAGLDFLPKETTDRTPKPPLSLDELIRAQQSQRRVLPGFLPQAVYLEHLHQTLPPASAQ